MTPETTESKNDDTVKLNWKYQQSHWRETKPKTPSSQVSCKEMSWVSRQVCLGVVMNWDVTAARSEVGWAHLSPTPEQVQPVHQGAIKLVMVWPNVAVEKPHLWLFILHHQTSSFGHIKTKLFADNTAIFMVRTGWSAQWIWSAAC